MTHGFGGSGNREKKRKSGPPRPIKQPAETGKGLLGTGGNALSAVKKLSMPSSLRSRMEGSFNADLSGVRLYESPSVEHHGFEAVAQGSTIGLRRAASVRRPPPAAA
jgi:hypothetical protein